MGDVNSVNNSKHDLSGMLDGILETTKSIETYYGKTVADMRTKIQTGGMPALAEIMAQSTEITKLGTSIQMMSSINQSLGRAASGIVQRMGG